MKKNPRYEIIAQNGQVLEYGFKSFQKAVNAVWQYKLNGHDDEAFEINEYEAGKYGKDWEA